MTHTEQRKKECLVVPTSTRGGPLWNTKELDFSVGPQSVVHPTGWHYRTYSRTESRSRWCMQTASPPNNRRAVDSRKVRPMKMPARVPRTRHGTCLVSLRMRDRSNMRQITSTWPPEEAVFCVAYPIRIETSGFRDTSRLRAPWFSLPPRTRCESQHQRIGK